MRINPKTVLVLLFFPLLQGCPAGVAIQVANVGAPLAGKMVGKIVTGIGSHVTSDNSSTSYSYTPSSSALSSESINIKETNSSNKLLGDSLDNINLCQKSTILSEGNSIRWGGAFNSYVRTAKSRGLSEQDCARNLGLVTTADSISTSTDNLHQIATKTICKTSLKRDGTEWDLSTPYFSERVKEAKLRGLTEQDCARILGRATTIASKPERQAIEADYTDILICRDALVSDGKSWDYRFPEYKQRAEDRGLSEQNCARILGRITTIASSRSSSRSTSTTAAEDRTVCYMALDQKMGTWDHSDNSRAYVRTAKARGYSPQDCANVLDQTTTVVLKKQDPQPSQALVKRTQEALKSLGLYRGIIDGVAGVKSKLALKQWQKSTGLAAPGEIKEDQIARLESDALEELAKQKQERQAKAKRVAEANRVKNPDAIAVIIGNRDYKGNTPDVEFAVNDADAMRDFVLKKLGYRAGNIIDLRDATQAELRDTFGTKESHRGRLFDYVRADESDVIVFYSGHGVPGMSDKRGYLLSVDANPNRAELTGYPVDTLLKNLSTIPAKSMTVFIDACFSGDSPKGMIVKSMSGLMVEIRQPKKTSSKMVVLTASRGDEAASWDEEAKHGLFTKHLLEALNGAADKQSKTGNKDGKVTLGEVKAYLDREMTYQARRRFSRDQHATVSGNLKTVLSAY